MDKLVDKDMNIDMDIDGNIVTIIGPTNSGKTYFLNKLCNRIDNSDIYIDDICIKKYDIDFLKNNICVVLNDDIYYKEYVMEELCYHLQELNYRLDEAVEKVIKISEIFSINSLLHERLDSLPLNVRILVKILSYLVINPKIIAIDNLTNYLDKYTKNNLFKYISDNYITLINVTSDANELMFSNDIVVMNERKCVLYGNIKDVCDGNSILPYMGIKLPFIIDLSQNLILYNLIDKVYYDDRKLVNKLWK